MPKAGTASVVRSIARELAAEMGYEFIDAELAKEHGSVFLRVCIEHEKGLDHKLCEAYHRRLVPLVDHLEFDYLEVSSPGIDRPFKTLADFERAVGKAVEIRLYKALEGRKEFSGELRWVREEALEIALDEGQRRFERKDIALARLAISYDALESGEVSDESNDKEEEA